VALFEITSDAITRVQRADFVDLKLLERQDLQRRLRDHIEVISSDTLVIAEEFSSWDRSDRRIDLLGVDQQGRLVVIELKRTADDKLGDLQALRYAAMISRMTFDEAVTHFASYLSQRGLDRDARSTLLEFLGWSDPADGSFADEVRIVLAAADFSPEVTSTVLWLNEHDLDIRCIRIQPYRQRETVLLDVQQIIPLPEAQDYQVQIREKNRERRTVAEQASDWTRYDVRTDGELHRAQFKRDAIYLATRFLVGRGIKPEEIQEVAGRRSMFEVVEGNIDGASFRSQLARRRPNDPRFVKRFFAEDNELLRIDGKTYALTNQWSKGSMEPAMEALIAKYGSLGLSYGVSQFVSSLA
jgi:hypothetical protein